MHIDIHMKEAGRVRVYVRGHRVSRCLEACDGADGHAPFIRRWRIEKGVLKTVVSNFTRGEVRMEYSR